MRADRWQPHVANTAPSEFGREVLAGLRKARKSLSCRFFYDEVGSELFEDITRTQDYYPTRAETAILREHAAVLAEGSEGAALVEFGSGSSLKTEILLAQMPHLSAYVPIDVSPSALKGAALRLAKRFPNLHVSPVVGDFTQAIALPDGLAAASRIGLFPGSTIGNFAPDDACGLLAAMAQTLGSRGQLIVGVDLRKDARTLIAAYNDREGTTAAFNLNLLARINRELGGTFDLQAFRHEALWNPTNSRIEMYLVSERAQEVEILGRTVRFAVEERIHTENSYKYTPPDFVRLARAAGWEARHTCLDPDHQFAVFALGRPSHVALHAFARQ